MTRYTAWPAMATLMLSAAAASASDEIARGTVYLDANGNGTRDGGEQGIQGVSVSNGRDVVQTDSSGNYEIALAPESVLFITKPAGYDVPVNEVQLPQFYYLHYPEGTPPVAAFEFPVVQPTGPLPERIDFRLLPGRDERAFKALSFADTQASSDEELDMLRIDVANALIDNPHGAAFGLTVGDIVDDELNLYPRHNRIMAQIGVPMWNLPGNHDMNFRAPSDRYATETYKSVFGPTNYSFDYGQVHFIALDNVEYAGDGMEFDSGSYRGYLSADQLQWLRNDLQFVAKDKLLVIATHISLVTNALDSKGQRDALGGNINTVNLSALLEVLMPFRHVYAIAGHDTSNSWKVQVDQDHGWHGHPFVAHTLVEVRGSDWGNGPRDARGVRDASMEDGNPNGYYVMSFDGVGVQPKFMPASGNPADAMRIVLDPVLVAPAESNQSIAIERGKLPAGARIVVNLFDGGERDRVEISINGGAYVAMTNILRSDPLMERLFTRYQGTDDAFPKPVPSSHIWEYPLPSLSTGMHVVRVRSLDEFGQRAHSALSFEVVTD